MVIYEARLKSSIPHVSHLINKLISEAEIDYNIAKESTKMEAFENKWGSLKDRLTQD